MKNNKNMTGMATETEGTRPKRIGIVGAGRGGTALLRLLQGVHSVQVVGICDIDPHAIGLAEAGDHGIATYDSAEALTSAQNIDWLINVSHTSLARRLLLNQSVAGVRVIDGDVSELIWRTLVAFDHEINDGGGLSITSPERASSIRALIWKVVSETADIVQQAHDRLADIAFRDPLTGLYTRRLLIEFLDKEISNAYRSMQPVSLLLLDLDHFKAVNDRFGHHAGDEILQCFAGQMKVEGRAGDMAARYGGEEFAMVLPGTDFADVAAFANRFRIRVAGEVIRPDGAPQTVSIGVAAIAPGRGRSEIPGKDALPEIRQQLIQSADEALYAAKDAGRNRVIAHELMVRRA